MAEQTKNSAAIAVKPSYSQHSTVGILLRTNLPYPVVEPQIGHKKLIAEEYLDGNSEIVDSKQVKSKKCQPNVH